MKIQLALLSWPCLILVPWVQADLGNILGKLVSNSKCTIVAMELETETIKVGYLIKLKCFYCYALC